MNHEIVAEICEDQLSHVTKAWVLDNRWKLQSTDFTAWPLADTVGA